MRHPKGLIPIVLVVLITIIAAGVVGAAWYYESNKDELSTTTNINVANTNNDNANTSTPQINLQYYKEMANNAPCSEIRNDLYLIDERYVVWYRSSQCTDNTYQFTLYDGFADAILCSAGNFFVGLSSSCDDENFLVLFNKMFENKEKNDLGIGDEYSVKLINHDVSNNNNLNTNPNTNTSTNTNTSATNTSDWQTYSNTTHNYSLKYPADYSLSGTEDRKIVKPNDSSNVSTLGLYVFTGKNYASFNEEELEWYSYAKNNNFVPSRYTHQSSMTIGGKTFTTFVFDSASASGFNHYYYVDGDVVWLIADFTPPGYSNKNTDVLSTFQFTY